MSRGAAATLAARRGRPPSRPAQHAALLDAAAAQINLGGAASISLGVLGAQIGVSRSALYYYCRDAADLAHQAYTRSCALMAQDIEAAAALHTPADRKLVALVTSILAPDRAPSAVLNDVDFLPEPLRDEVAAGMRANVRELAGLLEQGVRDGVFRDVDSEQSAQLILSSLSWAIVSLPWLQRRDDRPARALYIDTLCGLLLDGLAAPGLTPAPCGLDYAQIMARSINAFDRKQAAEQKVEQLLGVASRLFNARGLDGVRLDEVSDAVGATKGAIYHHFKDKSALIERAYDRAFDIYDHIMQLGVSLPRNALERAMVVTHLNAQAQLSPLPPLALQPGFIHLTGDKRRELTVRAQRLDQISVDILGQGVAEGRCRPLDMTFVPQIMAGQFLGLARHAPAHCSPVVMADFLTTSLAFGLRRRKGEL